MCRIFHLRNSLIKVLTKRTFWKLLNCNHEKMTAGKQDLLPPPGTSGIFPSREEQRTPAEAPYPVKYVSVWFDGFFSLQVNKIFHLPLEHLTFFHPERNSGLPHLLPGKINVIRDVANAGHAYVQDKYILECNICYFLKLVRFSNSKNLSKRNISAEIRAL